VVKKISVVVAAVAVNLAADFASGPPGAVNVDISSPGTYRCEQFVKFSSADASFICKVSNIGRRDGT
jgi:hypothetical protein